MKLCLLLSFLLVMFFGKGQTSLPLQIADSLYSINNYSKAAVWYEFILYENTNKSSNELAITGKLNCLKAQGLYMEATEFIVRSNNISVSAEFKQQMGYQEMLNNYLAGNFSEAINLSANYLETNDKEIKVMSYLVVILSLNELNKWKEADSVLQKLLKQFPTNDSCLSKIYTQIPHFKSESKAKLLSTLFPGVGQMYADKFWQGMANSLLQVGFLGFSIATFQKEYYYSAVLVGLNNFFSFRKGDKIRTHKLIEQYNRKKSIAFNQTNKLILIKYIKGIL